MMGETTKAETYALFSTAGPGKFHAPAEPFQRANVYRPTKAACGCTVVPVNYFETGADADRYTGGRLAQYMCRRCAVIETPKAGG